MIKHLKTIIFSASLCLSLGFSNANAQTSANFNSGSIIVGADSRACAPALEGSIRYADITTTFSPSDLTNLEFWLDPTQNITGNVSNWEPVGDPSKDFDQGTVNRRPSMTTANSVAILDFDRTLNEEDYLNYDNMPFTYNLGAGNFYIAMLINRDTANPNIDYLFTSYGVQLILAGTTPRLYFGAGGATKNFTTLNYGTGSLAVLEVWRDGTSVRVRLNNTLDTDSHTASNALNSNYINLGGPTSPFAYDGKIGDVIFAGDTTSAERDNALGYLNSKWGLGISGVGGSTLQFCDGTTWTDF